MTILVTGAAGFIGSHTVDALLRHHTVVGVDNLSGGRLENLIDARRSPRFTFVKGDVADQAFISTLIDEHHVRSIIHLAGMVGVAQSVENPEENFRLNVYAVDVLARAAVRRRCARFVFGSSAAVYGAPEELPLREDRSPCRPLSPYGAAKLAAEKLLEGYSRTFGLNCVILRYFNVYGSRQDPQSEYSGVISRFCARLSANEPLNVYGDGHQTRDFVHVKDVAEVNVNAATMPEAATNIYNVATGISISINQLVATLSENFQNPPVIRHSAARPAEISRSCGDPARLRSAGLLNTFTTLSAGLRETVRFLETQVADTLPSG